MLAAGAVAPDFDLLDHRGQRVRLADFRGRTVVLWFYPKADTPGCTKQGCGFRDAHASYAAKGIAVLGISFDDPAANRAFVEKFHFPFPLLCDTTKQTALAYGSAQSAQDAYPKRMTFVIGPDGLLRESIDTKDPGGQAAELLTRI